MFKLFFVFLLRIPYYLYFRMSVKGMKNIPKEGSCLILSNHVSMIDPPFIGVALEFHKQTKFMARDTLFRNPFMKYFLDHVGAIPLNRGTGFRGGFEKAFDALKNENVAIVAFPEGTRSDDGKLKTAKPGIGMLILQANVPIVPCYISGAYDAMPKGSKIPRPKKITFSFGEPFTIPLIVGREMNKVDYRNAVNTVMQKIAELGGVVEQLTANEGKEGREAGEGIK